MAAWTYNNIPFTEIPDGAIGFVYKIDDLINGKSYIGRKLFRFARTKMVKGKRKKTIVPSDWMDYYGSNLLLQEQVKLHGPEQFLRTILHICRTKGECNYLEAKELFLRDAIISDEYYNGWLSVRVSRNHLPKDFKIIT